MPDKKDLIPTNKEQESINNIKKMSAQDKAILKLVKENPSFSMYEIGKLLQSQGTSKSDLSVYSNLRYSQYLSLEIDKVHTHNHETLARQGVPRANKTLIRIVKDRNTPDLDKMPAINTILKHGLKQDSTAQPAKSISIGQINILQQMGRDDTEVVEGEVVDNTE